MEEQQNFLNEGEVPNNGSQRQHPDSGGRDLQEIKQLNVMDISGDMDKIMANAEKFIKVQDAMRKIAVRSTNIHDWIDEGGKPYLQEQGAQKIAMAFGVSIRGTTAEEKIAKDESGEYIIYTYSGNACWQGREMPQIGICTTRDKFFGIKSGKPIPLSEVNLANVRKKAYTNMLNRAIKSCLGLSFTWDELTEASGGRISQENLPTRVSYNSGNRGGKAPETTEGKAKKAELWQMLLDLYGNPQKAGDALEKATSFKGSDGNEVKGKRDINYVSEKQVDAFLYKKTKSAHTKWLKGQKSKGDDGVDPFLKGAKVGGE